MAEESKRLPDPDLPNLYRGSGTKATPALSAIIAEQIKQQGSIPFSNYMATALYHPEHGYYSRPGEKTGKQGDFITSVSIGPCFGIILAHRLHAHWIDSGSPHHYTIIEPGAHDGTLAQDILNHAKSLSTPFYHAIHYHLIEPSHKLREQQNKTLQPNHPNKYTSHPSWETIHKTHGAIISNELIDAFPVELIRFENNTWKQLNVTHAPQENFTFTPTEITSPEIKQFCSSLGNAFPEGYTTEYNTGINNFIHHATHALDHGLLLTIDYGHTQQDYYHPDRSTGTLQTYHNHQKSDNPLHSPGDIDITAHVDFTRLQQTAETAGFHTPLFTTQSSYLTQHAKPWLLEMERSPHLANPNLIKQFQTLTHPSMLGTKFHVLEMHK